LGGNQVVAPITAPINICGNAVAVLGDAAAGCLGGSHAGGPGRSAAVAMPTAGRAGRTALLPEIPVLPGARGAAHRGRGTGLNAGRGSELNTGREVAQHPGRKAGAPGAVTSAPAGVTSAPGEVTSAPAGVTSAPVGRTLPVGDLGLMSAARPAGVAGMNSGALAALLVGAMAALSATLFAATRRFRLGRAGR
ncbi:chaplin family protein, partial [Streptosporangium sp. NPDC048047]|uniref:chaplin family protein n=1 Tax=Streptosporangium sp. NPDC048047 TaxID=3155748 RepID=UPI00343B0988